MKKIIISMILVGGKGSRLKEITKDTAKPAVSFGAKYRLIDFTLSNITNSNIDVVGVVTQYEPFELMSYISSGASWDLDVSDGGIHFLTPFAKQGEMRWQKGTAHAIRQYFNFVKEYQADYVLILSGDQIYKMDYQLLLDHHLKHNADLTIACTPVPSTEASRFGIICMNEDSRITCFEEKPKNPKSNLASMGLYLFSSEILEKLLTNIDSTEEVDFGKDILPKSLKEGYIVNGYVFNGYWQDVGTVESLYQTNMDLLNNPNFLTLNTSKHLPVYSKSLNLPPHVILEQGCVTHSVIADGSIINGSVEHSVISFECVLKTGSKIIKSVLLPNVHMGENSYIENAIVNKGVRIPAGYKRYGEEIILIDSSNLMKCGEIHE